MVIIKEEEYVITVWLVLKVTIISSSSCALSELFEVGDHHSVGFTVLRNMK